MRTIFMILVLFAACTQVRGAESPEYWAQINKDGHGRNSNARRIAGNLRASWARALRNFTVIDQQGGQRSNNLCIRDGRILLITPASPPDAGYSTTNTHHHATYGIYSLANGALLHTTMSPQRGGGGLMVPYGIMDSDIGPGLVNVYWQDDGVVFTGQGSDHSGFWHFDAYTGEIPFGSPLLWPTEPAAWTIATANASGYFAKSNSNRYIYARGGAGSHNSLGEYGSAGLFGPVKAFAAGLTCIKMYNSYIVEGDRVYGFYVTNEKSLQEGYGVQIMAYRPPAATHDWLYRDTGKAFLCFGRNHCGGAPRAICMGEDNRLYYYGYYTAGAGTTQAPDFTRGMVLVGVRTSDGVADVNVPINYNPAAESASAYSLVPQIATLGKHVVIFQPQQGTVNGHVFGVDTVAKTVWRCDFPAQYFSVQTWPSVDATSPEQAVQLVVAGDSAFIVEPSSSSGALRLRVERLSLSTGARTTTVVTPVDQNGQPIAIAASPRLAMREVAAVDGRLVCLVDLGVTAPMFTPGVTDQAVVVISGDATPAPDYAPVPIISKPVCGLPMAKTLSDYMQAPTNQFDSGVSIAFSSVGSADPDGGNLAYHWDFGDGTTSTAPNPLHTYASSAQAPGVTQRTVRLTVTDDEGNSAQTTRVLAIRNVGGVQTLRLSAVADAYVDPSAVNANKNYGSDSLLQTYGYYGRKTYIRFDLSTVSAPLQSATLRLFSKSQSIPAGSSLSRVFARECSSTWGEATITAANAPAPGAVCGVALNKSFPNYSFYLEIPVTEYVQRALTAGEVSFQLEIPDIGSAFIAESREGLQPPELIILRGSPGYGPPSITQQPSDIVLPQTLSISAASPLGEAALVYHWLAVSGPGDLTFAVNHTNAAKATLVSTSVPGTYLVRCEVSDGLQTVSSRLASIVVKAPGTSGVPVAWGNNQYGQLGDGTTALRPAPVDIFDARNIKALATGNGHTLALLNDGTVMAWGDNSYGQLGIGSSASKATPVIVPNLAGVKAVAAGGYHSLALMNDGTLKAWGYNGYGALGDGTLATRSSPITVPGLSNVRAMAGGGYHSVAVLTDGTVYAWGRNRYGQLGIGSTIDGLRPAVISGLAGILDVAAGLNHSIFIHSDGSVSGAGHNASGQLGDGTPYARTRPVPMMNVTGVRRVACGNSHTLVLMSDGSVQACGDNARGQLGITGSARLLATPIPGLSGVTALTAGSFHSVVLDSAGVLRIWGDNSSGQLGDNRASASRPSPSVIPGLPAMIAIAAGGLQTLAIPPSGGGNRPPVAHPASVTTPEDTAVAVTLTGSDPDQDPLTFAITAHPAHGVLSGTAPHLTYTPVANNNGTDTFTFRVQDHSGASAMASVSITIQAVDDLPTVTGTPTFNTPLSMAVNATQVFTINASDPDGDVISYVWKVNGVVVSGASGSSYSFKPALAGAYTVAAVVKSGAATVTPPAWNVTATGGIAGTTTVLSSSANPVVYGNSVTITATVTPAPATGTVTFRNGGTVVGTVALAAGKASVVLPNLISGTHTLTAAYNGDSGSAPSVSDPFAQVVSRRSSAVTLASSANPANPA
ncbi:MAG TPA: Ig-like domain repeat protein, partial [Planctomycetota bacterium]|nr:Ig-like domain repeat protein [Planctomycetota bacterium]